MITLLVPLLPLKVPEQKDPAFRLFSKQTGPPLGGFLCPDWIKCAGIPESVFSLLLYEQEDERH